MLETLERPPARPEPVAAPRPATPTARTFAPRPDPRPAVLPSRGLARTAEWMPQASVRIRWVEGAALAAVMGHFGLGLVQALGLV